MASIALRGNCKVQTTNSCYYQHCNKIQKKVGMADSNRASSRQELLEHQVHNASTQESTIHCLKKKIIGTPQSDIKH